VICGEATVDIAVSPQDVLEFVLDLERYRQADAKIGRVRYVERTGDRGRARFGGRLRGLPTPPASFDFTLTPWTRLEFDSSPGLIRAAGVVFHGEFVCEEGDAGTRVTHKECFSFRPPLKWAAEPFIRSWLPDDTRAEMARMKAILEGAPSR